MEIHFETLGYLASERLSDLRRQAKTDGLIRRNQGFRLWKSGRANTSEPAPQPQIKPIPQECSLELASAGD